MRTSTMLCLVIALVACAQPRPADAASPVGARAGAYALEVVDEGGRSLPTFEHRGRVYVMGSRGARYLLKVRNGSGRRIEVVAAVDGRDVIDGKPSQVSKRGYIVDPYDQVLIDGFRLSDQSVAAFRFGSVKESYAAKMGDARDVGVIGVAVFEEQAPRVAQIYRGHRSYEPSRDEMPASPSMEQESRSSADMGSGAPSSAPAAKSSSRPAPSKDRSGLGTEFGEERNSPTYSVQFERSGVHPDAVLTLRYNDRSGLRALGIEVDGPRWSVRDEANWRESAQPFRRDPGYSQPPPSWSNR